MATPLEKARKAVPELQGMDDQRALRYLHNVYYSDVPLEKLARFAGVKLPESQTDKPAPESAGVMRTAGDVGIKLAQGVVDLGASVVGLGSLATGGLLGEGMEAIGYDPKRTNEALGEYLSDSQKSAEQAVQQAEGFGDTVVAAIQNPRAIMGGVAQSVPGLLAGGGIQAAVAKRIAGKAALATAEGASAAAGKAGAAAREAAMATNAGRQAAQAAIEKATGSLVTMGAGIEGAQTAGQVAQQAQQEGRDFTDYAPASLAAGLGTAVIGKAAGKVMGDAATDIFAGTKTGAAGNLAARVAKAGFSEGVLEEMPQSAQEQYFTNVALGKDNIFEGVGNAAGMGLVTGAAMGIGLGGFQGNAATATKSKGDVLIERADKIRRDEKLPEVGPLTASANAEVESRAKTIEDAAEALASAPNVEPPVEAPQADQVAVATKEIPLSDASEADRAAYEDAAKEPTAPVETAAVDMPPAIESNKPAAVSDDILTATGRPFKTLMAARNRAKVEGDGYVPVLVDPESPEAGYVVRKQEAANGGTSGIAAPVGVGDDAGSDNAAAGVGIGSGIQQPNAIEQSGVAAGGVVEPGEPRAGDVPAALTPRVEKGGRNLRNAAYAKNPLMTFLAQHGLAHTKGGKSLKSEFSPDKQLMVAGYGPVFRKNGRDLDELVQPAIEMGYLPADGTEQDLYQLIQRAVGGEKISPQFSAGEQDNIQARYEARMRLESEAENTANATEPEIGDAEYYGIEQEIYDRMMLRTDDQLFTLDDEIPWDAPSNASTEDFLRALGAPEGEFKDAIAKEQASAQRNDRNSASTQAAATAAPQGIDGESNEGARPALSVRPEPTGDSEGLTAPTREEVIAKQEQEDRARKSVEAKRRAEEEQARKEEERKRIAKASEAAADTFELGGDAMQNLTGQQDIFGAALDEPQQPAAEPPARPEPTPEPEGAVDTAKTENPALELTRDELIEKGRSDFASGVERQAGVKAAGYRFEEWLQGWNEAKADAEAKAAGKVALPSEFPLQEVTGSYSGISHSGAGRARLDRDAFVERVQSVYDDAKALANTDAKQAALDQAIQTYKDEYIKQTLSLARVRSGTYSAFVAGRAKINTRQADSRNSALDKAIDRFSAWDKEAAPKVKAAVLATRTADEVAAEQADKDAAQAAKQEKRRKSDMDLMRKILAVKDGHAFELAGMVATKLSNDKEGYPLTLTIKAKDGSPLVNDKLNLSTEVFGRRGVEGSKVGRQKIRELVDAIKSEAAAQAEKPAEEAPQVTLTVENALAEVEKAKTAGRDALYRELATIRGLSNSVFNGVAKRLTGSYITNGREWSQQSLTEFLMSQADQSASQETPVEKENTAAEKPASKTPTIDRSMAVMDAVRSGTGSLEDYKASFAELEANEEAANSELSTKTKDEILKAGGPYFYMRFKSEAKPEIIRAFYQDLLNEYALGKSYGSSGWVMSSGGFSAHEKRQHEALKALVAAQTDEDLKAFADEVAKRREEVKAKREAKKAAMENPQTLDDFRSVMREHITDGKTRKEAFLMLTPEQRIRYDELEAETTKEARATRKRDQKTEVRAAGQTTGGEIIATKHTRDGYDLFVVKLADRLSRDDYTTVLASAKKLGGWYSAFRGNGAIPGFQFKDKANAEAFLKLAGGDTTDAQEKADQRRDAFEDDRSETAVERLRTMADKLEEQSAAIAGADRKTNTARRARFASRALAGAAEMKAKAKTMRNLAQAIESGKAKFLDGIRTKSQVDMLTGIVGTAKYNELLAKHPTYAEQEKRKGEPPTVETADFAEFPSFTAYRSDLASLARQMLEVEGTKKLGQQLMKIADDVSDAYIEFAMQPNNLARLSTFSIRRGDEVKAAVFPSKALAERAIKRSGLTGKAIVLAEKRGANRIIMSPSEAMNAKIWTGDGDKRITLTEDAGNTLVEAIGRRGTKGNGLVVPWQFQTAHDRLKALGRMGIETPAEFRSALREFIGLQERAMANKVRELELKMVGKKSDGLDFFPTPAEVADQMVEAADIEPGMLVLEPSGGMGHIADRIRAAGAEPDVGEISEDRRELLEEKGYNLVARDFMDFKAPEERGFTFGDLMRAPDGTVGILRGQGGMGSDRVRLFSDEAEPRELGKFNFSELEGVERRGVMSGYDRIVMNPPFSNRRDAEHVRHAYTLLKPGGRIVAIMGEGVFFGQDKKAQDFRDWLDSVGGTDEKLPAGSFLDPSLPVNTGVNARMVVIDKPAMTRDDAREAGDDEPVFSRRKADEVAPVSRDPGKTPLYEAFRQLSRFDETFQTGTSTATDLEQIAKDMTAKMMQGLGNAGSELTASTSTAMQKDKRVPTLALSIKLKNGDMVKLLDIFDSKTDRPYVVIGNSEAGQGIGGATAYQIAFAWAHNNGKTMRPDPAGLTVINRLRRTEAMISSILHYGTDKHVEPHRDQYVALLDKVRKGGEEPDGTTEYSHPDVFNELEAIKTNLWQKGSTADTIANNVNALISASSQLAVHREPKIRAFEVAGGVLRLREDKQREIPLADMPLNEAAGEVRILGVVLRPASSGVGSSTLKRASVSYSVQRAIGRAKLDLRGRESGVSDRNIQQIALNAIRETLGKLDESAPQGLRGSLYSRADDGAGKGLGKAEATQIAEQIAERWDNAPEIVVAGSIQDAVVPERVRQQDAEQRSQGAEGAPEGFFFQGKVYLIADQLNSKADVARVLFHESLGHYGLRGNFGDALGGILKQVASMRAADIKAKAEEYGLDLTKERDRMIAAEEVLAEMAQTNPSAGFVKRAIAAIRQFLRDLGLDINLTDNDIVVNYLLPAQGWVKRGLGEDDAAGLPMFSRQDQTQTEAFKRWFGDSKVVDEKGRPLVMYHGTSQSEGGDAFTAFDTYASNYGLMGQGGYFTANPDVASSYTSKGKGTTPTVYAVYLSIKNPIDMDANADTEAWQKQFDGIDDYHEGGDTNESWYRAAEAMIADQMVPMYEGAEMMQEGLRAMGYDGITHIGGGRVKSAGVRHRVYVAFHPEQIKSATGNNGNFDPENADIRFSRVTNVPPSNETDIARSAEFQGKVRDYIADLSKTSKKVNWWGRTVGTQYHKAERNADFKKVFDATQAYISSTSAFANNAANLAKDILPQLESMADLTKKWLSDADRKAIARPIFEGTLSWSRDEDGKLVEADDVAMAGVVFTAAELKSEFGLNDQQVKLYRQFRAAVDKSLGDAAVTDALRYLGKSIPDDLKRLAVDEPEIVREAITKMLRDKAREAGKAWMDAQRTMRVQLKKMDRGLVDIDKLAGPMARNNAKDRFLQRRAALEQSLQAAVDAAKADRDQAAKDESVVKDKFEKIDSLSKRGYAPLTRFGKFSVTVTDPDTGAVNFFGLFETEREANKAARELAEEGTVSQGLLSEQSYRLFSGVSPDTLEIMGEAIGVEDKAMFEAYIKMTKSQRSTMKRLLKRKGVPGFSEDVTRVLASFLTGNARASSANLHLGDATRAATEIREGDVKDEAVKLVDYVKNPQEEAQAIRGLLFAQFLGGSVASALVNMTQPFTMTLPYLSKFSNPAKAGARMVAAMKSAVAGVDANSDLGKAMARAEADGIVSPQEIHQLQAEVTRSSAYHRTLRKAGFVWGSMFSLAEQFNRRTTFIAAYEQAKADGKPDPYAFATKAVEETQGIYNKANKPNWARGAVGGVVFTFKQYSISYLEFLTRLPRREQVFALAILMLAAGAEGLPFADDLDDLADTLGQHLGYNWNSKREKREFLTETIGMSPEFANLLLKGGSALPGVPIDVAGRMGLANLVPGTGLLLQHKEDKSRDVVEFIGPAGSLAQQAVAGVGKLLGGDVMGAGKEVAPVAVQNLIKAADMSQTGMYRDMGGRKVVDVDGVDALFKGAGFQPKAVAEIQLRSRIVSQDNQLARQKEKQFAQRWAEARFEGDQEAEQKVRAEVQAWNERNPEARIRINMADIAKRVRNMKQDRVQRTIKQATPEMRAYTRDALQ